MQNKTIITFVIIVLLFIPTYLWYKLPSCSDTDGVYAIRIVRTEERIVTSPIINKISFLEGDIEFEGDSGIVYRTGEFFPVDWTEEEKSIDITHDGGDGEGFSEVEFILEVESSTSIKPIFKYATDEDLNWIKFYPFDGTNGLQDSHIVAWDVDDLKVWGCR